LNTGGVSTDVEEPFAQDNLPGQFHLSQNYPNPFNPTTSVSFSLPSQSQVSLVVYNLLGQNVREVVNRVLPAGDHVAIWDGVDSFGKPAATGVYFYRLETDLFVETKKMLLLK